jgi:hypothetical protein
MSEDSKFAPRQDWGVGAGVESEVQVDIVEQYRLRLITRAALLESRPDLGVLAEAFFWQYEADAPSNVHFY